MPKKIFFATMFACLYVFSSAAPFATQPTQPMGTSGGLTRQTAVRFIAACEKVWFNQAAFYRVRCSEYDSIEKIQEANLLRHGYKLTVLSPQRQIDESLMDSRDNPAGEWRRSREIVYFDGKERVEWLDYENEMSRQAGGRESMLQNPDDLYAFHGLVNGQPLSEMIAKADEFYWSPEIETVGGDRCAIANCVFKSSLGGIPQTTRFELALAIDGALFPKIIMRFIDRGEGEKRTAAWEALEVEKDEARRIWHLKQGRYYNVGANTVSQIDVLIRRELKPVQDSPAFFSIDLPAGASAATTRPSARAGNRKPHREVSFFPKWMNIHVTDLETRLNKTYTRGFVPAWGRDVTMPKINNEGSKPK